MKQVLEELEIMLPKASDSESEDESVGDSDDMEDDADPKGAKTSVKKKTVATKGKKGGKNIKSIANPHSST